VQFVTSHGEDLRIADGSLYLADLEEVASSGLDV